MPNQLRLKVSRKNQTVSIYDKETGEYLGLVGIHQNEQTGLRFFVPEGMFGGMSDTGVSIVRQ